MSNTFLTREQEYAKRVYTKIEQVLDRIEKGEWDDTKKKAYGSLAHKLPVLIRTGGLAQSLAFVQARNKEGTPQRQLLIDLQSVLQERSILGTDKKLIEESRDVDFDSYMRLTEASLEALLWFKRFAQSELKVEITDQPPEGQDE